MRNLKTLLAAVLALALCLGSVALAEEAPIFYSLGDTMADFTVTTYDGQTVTLSEVLQEKEAVLINIWATWCGPCRQEFPFMEEAYEQYSDKVEIIALSCEPTDDADVLAEFVATQGLTFKVGQDTVGMADMFQVDGIPTSVLVDRFGTICYWESGSMPDTASFTRLFDMFLGDDYTESNVIDGLPKVKPNVEGSSAEELAAALNAEGAALTFANSADEMIWPMIVGEKDGRQVVSASNTGVNDSEASVSAAVTVAAGDAVVVTFKTSCEAVYDLMQIRVNGETVKSFGGEKDWMTYAWPVAEDGTYEVTVAYVKDGMEFAGEDNVWVDSIAVVSGDEAAAALAANPSYPTTDETYAKVLNPDAKEITINDPTGALEIGFPGAKYYTLLTGQEITVEFGVSADVDPETAYAVSIYDGSVHPLCDLEQDGKYVITTGVDAMETTGYSYSNVAIYSGDDVIANVVYFLDEPNTNAFMQELADPETGVSDASWTYADGTAPSTDEVAELSQDAVNGGSYMSAYTVKYVDQNGDPVEGVMCQVCDDETCQVFVSDAGGVCSFELVPYAWEIHTLRVPEGYEGDTETITIVPEEGCELVITLTRN